MTTRTTAQLLMRRPHLRDIPAMPLLAEGYALRTASGEDDEHALAHTLTGAFGEEWSVDRVREQLTGSPSVLAVYVITWEGQPVATASSRWVPDQFPADGYVHWVGTHPNHVRRGLGLALMVRVLHDFRDRGYQGAVLETDSFRLPAIRTYLRCGFVPEYDVKGQDHRERWSTVFQAEFDPSP